MEQLVADNEARPSPNEILTEEDIPEDPILKILDDNIANTSKPDDIQAKVFLNPSSQNTLLSNFTNGVNNVNKVANGSKNQAQSSRVKSPIKVEEQNENNVTDNTIAISTRNTEGPGRVVSGTDDCSSGELGSILENNQTEIDLCKDLLHGCGMFDPSMILGLFNEGASEYGLSFSQDELNQNSGDPMVSGQEIATYPMLPLDQLFDDSLNNTDIVDDIIDDDLPSELNTPQVSDFKPSFPIDKS